MSVTQKRTDFDGMVSAVLLDSRTGERFTALGGFEPEKLGDRKYDAFTWFVLGWASALDANRLDERGILGANAYPTSQSEVDQLRSLLRSDFVNCHCGHHIDDHGSLDSSMPCVVDGCGCSEFCSRPLPLPP